MRMPALRGVVTGCVLLASAAARAEEPAEAEPTRDYMVIVGSTTVAPFIDPVIDRLVENHGLRRPQLQATGSGGGLMVFCAGVGPWDADIAAASRRIRRSELDICEANGVEEVVEVKIGYDGIVLAASRDATPMNLTIRDLYLALAKEVPDPSGAEAFVPNPYRTWNDVNPDLPRVPIKVFGPGPGSGTGTVLGRVMMTVGCNSFDWVRDLREEEPWRHRTVCRTPRGDGGYVVASEDDEETIQRLVEDPGARAFFSFAIRDQSRDEIRAMSVNGFKPELDSIADGSYPISRPLYLYVKTAHVDRFPGIRELLMEVTRAEAWNDDGYLWEMGLVPMSPAEQEKYADDARRLVPLLLE